MQNEVIWITNMLFGFPVNTIEIGCEFEKIFLFGSNMKTDETG